LPPIIGVLRSRKNPVGPTRPAVFNQEAK
jgi:hypothetical protein